MTKGQTIEYRIVNRTVTLGEQAGLNLNVIRFTEEFRDSLPSIEVAEVTDALKRLHLQNIVTLHKWEGPNFVLRNFESYADENEFFFNKDIRVKRTPFSRTYSLSPL